MDKVNIIGFEDWKIYDGFAEGSGRSEKIWLVSDEGQIGLFKYPKIDPNTSDITTEHISEHKAYRLGQIVGVPTAKIDIGIRGQRIGSMSYLLNKSNETIIEGADYMTALHSDYNLDKMMEGASGRYYCLEHLLEICDDIDVQYDIIQMMIFDFLIGNSDRHQNNWAIMRDEGESLARFCPLYDNGSSLCSYVTTEQAKKLLGNDKTRFEALVDTKSRSMIRIDGMDRKRPTHKEVTRYLLGMYTEACVIADGFIDRLSLETIEAVVDVYTEFVEDDKKELLKRFVKRKIEILIELRKEVI